MYIPSLQTICAQFIAKYCNQDIKKLPSKPQLPDDLYLNLKNKIFLSFTQYILNNCCTEDDISKEDMNELIKEYPNQLKKQTYRKVYVKCCIYYCDEMILIKDRYYTWEYYRYDNIVRCKDHYVSFKKKLDIKNALDKYNKYK